MSALQTTITLPLGGGQFRFHLGEDEMCALEMGWDDPDPMVALMSLKMIGGPGPMRLGAVYARLLQGRFIQDGRDVGVPGAAAFSVKELNAIIRMALLGGGGGERDGEVVIVNRETVKSIMADHIYPMTLMERWDFCLAILGARVEGVSDAETAAA